MKPIKKVAVLHSLCGVGKASLTNMIPVLSVMGVEVCPIPTIVLSTHTGGYGAPARCPISRTYIQEAAKHYRENGVTFDAIFIGYLGSEEMVSSVQYFIQQFPNVPVILDPIFGDHGTFYQNLGPTYAESFERLLCKADVILPNYTEGCILADSPYTVQPDGEELAGICKTLRQKGAKNIVMTSIPTGNENKGITLCEGETVEMLTLPGVAGEFHGTGDVFDAVFLGAFLEGLPLKKCIEKAHTFVCECMERSIQLAYPKREGLAIERCLSLLV